MRSWPLVLVVVLAAGCAPATHTCVFRLTLDNRSAKGQGTAEDGTSYDVEFAPGLVIVHDADFQLFADGQKIALAGLEALGEDGDPTTLEQTLAHDASVCDVTFLQWFDADYKKGAIPPGQSTYVNVGVKTGQLLTVVSMYGQSNDVVVAALGFDPYDADGKAIAGDLTSKLSYFDIGTEVNQPPGIGADQAPRESAPNTGASEDQPVHAFSTTDASGYAYPAIPDVLALTIGRPQ